MFKSLLIFTIVLLTLPLIEALKIGDPDPKNDGCPHGFEIGVGCNGEMQCYYKTAVPEAERRLAVQDNYCKKFNAHVASIHCGAQHRDIVKKYGRIGIGLFVPSNLKIELKNFKWEDGTPKDYEFWDRFHDVPVKQPGNENGYERNVMTQAESYGKRLNRTRHGWHDESPSKVEYLLCSVPSTQQKKATVLKEVHNCPSGWDFAKHCGVRSCYKIRDVKPEEREIALPKNICNQTHPKASAAYIGCAEEDEWVSRYGNGFTIGLTILEKDPWDRPNNWDFHYFHFLTGTGKRVYDGWDTNPDLPKPQPDNAEGKTGMERVVMHTRLNNDPILPQNKREKQYQHGWNDYQPKYITRLLCKMPEPGTATVGSTKKCRNKRLRK